MLGAATWYRDVARTVQGFFPDHPAVDAVKVIQPQGPGRMRSLVYCSSLVVGLRALKTNQLDGRFIPYL